jgi:hypothetical protein
MTLEGLKYELNEILSFLNNNPQPGLFTWHEVLFRKLNRLRSKLDALCNPELRSQDE